MKLHSLVLGLISALILAIPAMAEHWHADRLRGVVLMMAGGDWVAVQIGDVVDDGRVLRTGADGHVTLRSGPQLVEMRPNSQIQLTGEPGRARTWVYQAGGEITADVEARDVEHFGVQTHNMVAVVKGTRFTVTAGPGGESVSVDRGTVGVTHRARRQSVSITAGQRAEGRSGSLRVEGRGALPPIVDEQGRPVAPATPAPVSGPATTVAPGNSAHAPGHAMGTPAQPGSPPGKSDAAPGHAKGAAPGNSGSAPGKAEAGPKADPGKPSGGPGKSGSASGRADKSPPGQSGKGGPGGRNR
ncbi:FecR domain-containing protein [Pelagibacterium montanilacus]|uniref:FecR domain-containing protein n=1 Tax=Pelagibacterium montanilacus TaxID=2185280 RepID=UPI000F8DCD32|nr:FecR domain-containing protein [Pelagibacterium montanilacus]